MGVIWLSRFWLIFLLAFSCGNGFIFSFILDSLVVVLFADPNIDPDSIVEPPFVDHVNQEEAGIKQEEGEGLFVV